MTFDYRNITRPDYYFVVDGDGNAWTDTADMQMAIDVASKLANRFGHRFDVFSSEGRFYSIVFGKATR